jgi:drug/metabolite transporter (DMT)-like permease
LPEPEHNPAAGYVYAVGASLGLGAAVALSRAAYDGGTDPISVAAARSVFGMLLVAGLCLATGRSLRVPRRLWLHLLGLGLLVGYMFYGHIGAVQYIPVGLAALLFFMYPPLVAIMVAVLDRRKLGFPKAVALAGSFVGLALMLGIDFGDLDWRGVVMALAAGIGCAVNAVWISRVMRGVDVLVMTFYMTAVACVMLVAIAIVSGGVTLPTSTGGWLGASLVVLFQGCSIPFFYAAIPRIGPEKTAVLNNLQPVSSILFAYFLFAQTLSAVQFLGGTMVLGGILLMQWHERRRS